MAVFMFDLSSSREEVLFCSGIVAFIRKLLTVRLAKAKPRHWAKSLPMIRTHFLLNVNEFWNNFAVV